MPNDDLTPQDEQVRRLLSGARHEEPMPDDVAARLDEVLAGLRDDRPPVDIAARQRRRHVRNWVLAAAAVVVIGVGANQVDWSGMSMSGDDADGSASSAMEGGANDAGVAAPSEAAPGDTDDLAGWKAARLQLTPDGFGDEVDAFRARQGEHLLRYTDAEVPHSEL